MFSVTLEWLLSDSHKSARLLSATRHSCFHDDQLCNCTRASARFECRSLSYLKVLQFHDRKLAFRHSFSHEGAPAAELNICPGVICGVYRRSRAIWTMQSRAILGMIATDLSKPVATRKMACNFIIISELKASTRLKHHAVILSLAHKCLRKQLGQV